MAFSRRRRRDPRLDSSSRQQLREAREGWLFRNPNSCVHLQFLCVKFLIFSFVFVLLQIGQGTYSNVYKARDLISGKIVALKKVRFDNLEPESVKFMAREILVLRKLDHPNVLKLEGLATSRMSCSLYLVFEYMEHDLAGLAARSGVKFTEAQVHFNFDSFRKVLKFLCTC